MRRLIGTALLFLPLTAVAEPQTDTAVELFEQGPAFFTNTLRSPFGPAVGAGEEMDVSALELQGIIHGSEAAWALISGRIVRTGEMIGLAEVKEIQPDQVVLSSGGTEVRLKLSSYVAPPLGKEKNGHAVELQNAPLKDALTLLAKASNLNLIMPEDLAGAVNLSFVDTDLKEALRSILRVNGYEYALEAGIIRIGKPEAFAGGTDLKTQQYRLKYANARDLVEKVKLLLSDRGAVIADDRTNTLIVKDRDAIIGGVSGLVGSIDRRDQQVQIEAQIVDASHNFSRSLGIRWGGAGTKGDVNVSGTGDVGTGRETSRGLNVNLGTEGATSGINLLVGRLSGDNVFAQLTAAEKQGEVRVLSRPSVRTLNNIAASIRSGTKFFVKPVSAGAGGATLGGANVELKEIKTGIELKVTPQISIDDYIKLVIEAIESEADFSRTVDGIPAVIDNTATTTVLLKNGETTVIGGLYRNKSTKEKRGVPGFQKIPVFGALFRSRLKKTEDAELIIFITPKIVGS